MIFSLICILIILYGCFIDFKKSFLFFLVFQLVWFPDAQLVKLEGFPSINLNFIMAVYFVFMFLINKQKYSFARQPFPYKVPMIMIAISLLLTSFTSVVGFSSELLKALGLILINLVMVYLIWEMVEFEKDFTFLFKWITIVLFVACAYGLYSYMQQNNPIVDYKFSLASGILRIYSSEVRGYRWQSFWEHPISAAMILGIYVVFVLYYMINSKKKMPLNYLAIITAVVALPCIVLTKMRTGIFFLVIGILAIVNFRKIRFYKMVPVMLALLLLAIPFIREHSNLFLSFFDETAQNAVAGSNAEMRFEQFDAVYHIMMMSPVFGLGENFRSVISNVYTIRALDFESIWFEQMSEHGLVGVVAYLCLVVTSIVCVPRKYKSKFVFFVTVAYWLTYTLTSTPYFREYLLYIFIFYAIKQTDGYKENERISKRKIRFKFKVL